MGFSGGGKLSLMGSDHKSWQRQRERERGGGGLGVVFFRRHKITIFEERKK